MTPIIISAFSILPVVVLIAMLAYLIGLDSGIERGYREGFGNGFEACHRQYRQSGFLEVNRDNN